MFPTEGWDHRGTRLITHGKLENHANTLTRRLRANFFTRASARVSRQRIMGFQLLLKMAAESGKSVNIIT